MGTPRTIIEPEASTDAPAAAHRLAIFNATSLRSAAISLKRIADAMEHAPAPQAGAFSFPTLPLLDIAAVLERDNPGSNLARTVRDHIALWGFGPAGDPK